MLFWPVSGPPQPSDNAQPRRLVAIAVLCVVATVALAVPQGLGFTTSVTPGLIDVYTRQFGTRAPRRLEAWLDFARNQKGAPALARLLEATGADRQVLGAVNAFFNRIPWLTDQEHWGIEDYWSTPAELTASNGGDCEDYSIAKYFMLKELGVPVGRMRITYVKAIRINQAHMVLAYYATPDADPLILDNMENEVRPASQRTDLVPVYSFNDDDILIVRDARRASPLQIRAWRDLLHKLEDEERL